MGWWRSFAEWFQPSFIEERNRAVQDALDDNDALRKEVRRLQRRVQRLETELETAKGREEAQAQTASLLRAQARRCKCRS